MPAPSITLTPALRAEYQQLFDSCQIRPEHQAEVHAIAARLVASRPRYQDVAGPLGLPWHVVAVIHSLEGSGRFDTHLHNGDPLTARTRHVPAGRPKTGTPPFTWEHSATDALTVARYPQWTDWSVPGILFKWEGYNGFGYRRHHPEVKSPYLWGFTNHHLQGKYVADGTWSPTARTRQAGAAALLRRLAELGEMDAAPHAADPALHRALQRDRGALRFNPRTVTPGAMALQQFLNGFPGVCVREDGRLGQRTSDACRVVFGQRLAGDPRT